MKHRLPVLTPTLSDVVYATPNPDGSRKACANCFLYIGAVGRCVIHAPDLPIRPSAVCGYHVFGVPLEEMPPMIEVEPQDPALTGLINAHGTSCDICTWYERKTKDRGICHGVIDDKGAPAGVQALGCCARWARS
jgi:hypothetical protein